VFIEKRDSIPAYFIGMDKLSGDALEAHKEKFKGAIIYNTNPATVTGIHVWKQSLADQFVPCGSPQL
jgi:hypothetical protein